MEYADTSFLISLYFADSNHRRAVSYAATTWTVPPQLPLTPFGAYEFNNTLRHLLYRGVLRSADLAFIAQRLTRDLGSGMIEERPLEAYRLIDTANRLSRQITPKTGTRALDLLHVALAQIHGAKTFLTFDKNQASAAVLAGMKAAP